MRILSIVICLLATAWPPLHAQELKGVVTTSSGQPISGALVSMYTAHPRVGPGVL